MDDPSIFFFGALCACFKVFLMNRFAVQFAQISFKNGNTYVMLSSKKRALIIVTLETLSLLFFHNEYIICILLKRRSLPWHPACPVMPGWTVASGSGTTCEFWKSRYNYCQSTTCMQHATRGIVQWSSQRNRASNTISRNFPSKTPRSVSESSRGRWISQINFLSRLLY